MHIFVFTHEPLTNYGFTYTAIRTSAPLQNFYSHDLFELLSRLARVFKRSQAGPRLTKEVDFGLHQKLNKGE